jgi:integrase
LENEPLHLRVLITLAITTGLRRAELAGLTWPMLDLDNRTLEVKQTIPKLLNGEPVIKGPKNKKSLRIALSPSVIQELKPSA